MASRRNKVKQNVDEDFIIKTEFVIRKFIGNDNQTSYEFPSTLTNAERAWIHDFVKTYSLSSKSYGKEPNRKLRIMKRNDITNIEKASLSLSKESIQLVKSFLCKYPPNKEKIEGNNFIRQKNNDSANTSVGQLTNGIPLLPTFGVNNELLGFRMNLPIWHLRDHIIEQIITNQVVIIRGETGSGKTTQIPQFILDYSTSCKEKCRIICTQPRRISAISVAERVSEERGEKTGQTVGYHIRLESCVGPKTSLIYCTNGILLRTLMNGDSCLSSYTHIIVDEIHERDRFSDFLLICLRECLANYPHIRLILMSATIDVESFETYFNNPPIIYIPGRLHNVSTYFLDEILPMLQYESPAMRNAKGNVIVKREITYPKEEIGNSDLRSELDECINDCFTTGFEDSFNFFIQYVLNEHVPVNYQHSQSGYTALMAAAVHGNLNICVQLLQFGANVKLRSSHENLSAVDWAFAKQHIHVYEILKQHEQLVNNTPAPVGIFAENEAKLKLDLYQHTIFDQNIDYDLLIHLLYYIHSTSGSGSILIFLAGYDDIVTVKDRIMSDGRFRVNPFEIFTLHGMMQMSDQHRVFKQLRGARKIILSTNIAETSITIDDVVFVIDSGKVKEKTYDAVNGVCSLQCCWISQSAAKQRAGRAGRTQPGYCFYLFSRNRYESMQAFATPEMLRMPLHELCLQTKLLAPKNVKIASFISRALEPPSSMAVKQAIKHLQEIGALDKDEDLTLLGQHLVDLPVEPRLAKMLIYSVIFRCVDPVLTIVAFLSYRDPFMLPMSPHNKSLAVATKKQYSVNTFSDHMILLKSFQAWQDARLAHEERLFCTKNYISSATMDMVVKIRAQLLAQLRAGGFVNTKPPGDIRELNENSNNWAMVKGILTAGFLPNIAFIDKHQMKIQTKTEKKVALSITSSLRIGEKNSSTDNVQSLKNMPSNWLIFEELSRNNGLYNIKSITCVSPITVALFSNNTLSEDSDSDEESAVASQQWIYFDDSNPAMEIIQDLRNKMNCLIDKKISHPHKLYSTHDNALLSTIAALLLKEDEVIGFYQPIGIGQRPKVMNCDNGNQEESVKNRFRMRQHSRGDEQYFCQMLAFKKVVPTFYNKFVPPLLNSNNGVKLESSLNMGNIVKQFEDFNIENGIVPYENVQNGLPEDDFKQNGTNVDLEGACALESSYRPLWMEQIMNPEWTVYCLIRTGTSKSIDVSIGKKVWVFPPYIEKKLKLFFETGKNILLVFTVVNSRSFQAIARLVKMPAIEESEYNIQSSLEWISRADISYSQVPEFFPDQYNDGDQLNHSFGIKLWQLFTNFAPPSIQHLEPMFVAGVPGTIGPSRN